MKLGSKIPIQEVFENLGIVRNGYIKIRDGLWIRHHYPYKIEWNFTPDVSMLPTEEELMEIIKKVPEIINIQEECGISSLMGILEDKYPIVWSSREDNPRKNYNHALTGNISNGKLQINNKFSEFWFIPVIRSEELLNLTCSSISSTYYFEIKNELGIFDFHCDSIKDMEQHKDQEVAFLQRQNIEQKNIEQQYIQTVRIQHMKVRDLIPFAKLSDLEGHHKTNRWIVYPGGSIWN